MLGKDVFSNLAVPWEHQKSSPGSRGSLAGVACQIYNYLQVCGKLLNFSLSVGFPVCQEFLLLHVCPSGRQSVWPPVCMCFLYVCVVIVWAKFWSYWLIILLLYIVRPEPVLFLYEIFNIFVVVVFDIYASFLLLGFLFLHA